MPQRKAILVEADKPTAEALQNIFIRKGWEVVVVTTVVEALAVLRDYVPTWIVATAGLPDGSGEALVRHVRAEKKATRIALLAASADAVSDPKPDLVLRKPANPEDVYARCDGFDKPMLPVSSIPASS
jgi:ActR/RegA family two-component response regulator